MSDKLNKPTKPDALWKRILMYVVLAVLSIVVARTSLGPIDSQADAYFEDSIQKAGASYIIVRGVNGAVSVIQNSDVHIQPMGIGINVAAGEVLDPVNDMAERTSSVLVTAVASLVIQKMGHTILQPLIPWVLAFLFASMAALTFAKGARAAQYRRTLWRLVATLILLRLLLPFSAMLSTIIYTHYFEEAITEHNETLEAFRISDHLDIELPDWPDSLSDISRFVTQSTEYSEQQLSMLNDKFKSFIENAGQITDSLLSLAALHLALFVMQVILLPIGIFWLMTRLINGLFETQIPVLLSDRELLPKREAES